MVPEQSKRFWAKVDVRGADECWPWTGSRNRTHGTFHWSVSDGSIGAHRAAYLLAHGKIDCAMEVDHACNNSMCVNPAHLRQATREQNARNRSKVVAVSGLKGVVKVGNKWRAQIKCLGVPNYLGMFSTPEEAHEAYCVAGSRMFGKFFNGGAK